MARFTKTEKKLLKCINDERLLHSLAGIRQAMENIWKPEIRIIKDFTDHGENHCIQLTEFVSQLLDMGKTCLTSKEMYLLLASIYLHDIGMQCDVVIHKEILEVAQKLGAGLHLAFVANSASTYTLEEQKAIRNNHHYLSAAWIDVANRSGDTMLGPAAKEIPIDLVDDIIDICLHHTKLPITDCSKLSKYDPNIRKQLLASLLRFSDELDHACSIKAA